MDRGEVWSVAEEMGRDEVVSIREEMDRGEVWSVAEEMATVEPCDKQTTPTPGLQCLLSVTVARGGVGSVAEGMAAGGAYFLGFSTTHLPILSFIVGAGGGARFWHASTLMALW